MSIFDTTGPTGFNSFDQQPLSNLQMGGGGWGMNPSYLSPAYTAPYRPPYTGGHIANQNPGFFKSLYGISPLNFRGSPYGVNTAQDESNYWDSLQNRPSDFGMAGAQRVAAPLLAFGGAMAFARAWQKPMPSGAAGSMVRGWNSMWGGAGAATISGFTNMGAKFAGGAAEGLITGTFGRGAMTGAGFGGAAARGAVGLAGGIGAAAAGIGIPLMLAQGAISAFDNLVSDNYIGMRENASTARSAFRGVSLGGGVGDRFTGQGLSRESAGRMGTNMAQFGSKDQVFNSREIASMTSMSAQMGLLDNVSGEQLTSRMKSIVNQVKAVMSIAGTTEFKEAIQVMARLQMAGVSPHNISSTFSGLGSYASQAGVNVNRMINTVGAQGQYLFQANGLTPYVGQITAANAMAGFGSAFRSGLIGPELMARMGGVEGATQSSLTGQLNAAQTTYNTMRGFNRYSTGRGGSGVIENISNFGNTFAGNPLAAYGALQRTGRANVSQMLKDDGPMAIYNQAREIANINPLVGNRKMNQDELFALLMPMMGNDPKQVEAYMSELGSYQDDKTMNLRKAGIRSNRINMQKDYLHQTEQTLGMTLPGVQGAVAGYRSLSAGITGALGNFYSGGGGMYDKLSAALTGANIGSADKLAGGTAQEFALQESSPVISFKSQTKANQTFNRNLSEHMDDIQKLMQAASAGDKVAQRALRGDSDAIQRKADSGLIDSKYSNANDAAKLAGTVMSLPKTAGNRLEEEANRMAGDLKNGIFGANVDMAESLKGYRLAFKLQQELEKNPDAFDAPNDKVSGLLQEAKGRFGEMGTRDLTKRIGQALGEAADFGVDVSRDYESQRRDESASDYAWRTNMRFDPATTHKNRNASLQDKIKGLKGRAEVNTQENQQNQARETLMGMGRIDMVAAYDMSSAAGELKEAAKDLKNAAQTMQGKEMKPTDAPTIGTRGSFDSFRNSPVGRFITGGDRK